MTARRRRLRSARLRPLGTVLALLLVLTAGPSCSDRGESRDRRVVVDSVRPAADQADREGRSPADAAEAPERMSVPEFRLRLDPDRRQVAVRLELDVPRPAPVHLLYLREWEGFPGLGARLQDLEASGPGGQLQVEAGGDRYGPGHRIIRVAQPGHLTLQYNLFLEPPAHARHYHRVSQLSTAGGHLLGRDLLPRVWLDRPTAGPQPARVRFDALPAGWRIASVAGREGNAYAVDEIQNAVFVLGPLRTRLEALGLRSLIVAVNGEWPVEDERLLTAAGRIAGVLHNIARDGWPAGDYLYHAGRVPAGIGGQYTGGQVVDRSALVVSGGGSSRAVYDSWVRVTSHELMHWYIPRAFDFADEPPRWFSEGFTDYFALKTQLAAGLIDGGEFLAAVGARLHRYRESPLFGQRTMAEAQTDFWDDDAYRYIYDGGAAAAFLLDLGFQARGRSLERALGRLRAGGPITRDRLSQVLAGVRENDWIADWLTGTEPQWDTELARYRLSWSGDALVSADGWATDVLSSIRP